MGGTRSWSLARTYLVEREALFERIRSSRDLPALVLRMTGVAALLSALYGFTVGLYAGGWQIFYNVVKLPMLFLATLALCVFALYVLNSLAGARLSLLQTAAVVLTAIVAATMLLASLAPPLGFLMLTSLQDYQFVALINLLVGCLVAAGGARFAFQAAAAAHADEAVRARCLGVMRIWLFIYGAVGLQMVWLFRPFFRQTEVFIRPLAEQSNAFEAFLALLLSVITRLI
jgi:hypothetical protein